ncbi:hypothetical protein VNO77_07429 [Canavalia gladiata]|uniref:Uncharacterized protein n=1 Tax=Canavalia gladiata TaxID=3824 RepID=A0AAN9QTE0_CANGL
MGTSLFLPTCTLFTHEGPVIISAIYLLDFVSRKKEYGQVVQTATAAAMLRYATPARLVMNYLLRQNMYMKPIRYIMDFKRPRKLNLNAPLLSTRRLGNSLVADTSCSSNSAAGAVQNSSERVPFSWEKAPGKPKEMERIESTQDGGTPRLRLPPCHRFPPKDAAEADEDNEDVTFQDQVDGSCDDGDDNKDDFFSDAVDVFSLSEALDIVQKKSENENSENNDGLRLKLAESNGYQSPTYMISRFLPDATALAASSALQFQEKTCDTCSYPECYLSGSARHSYASSPKGCGLELLFPWRMKHKLCAMESPVLPCSTNVHKHQRNPKQKKHHRSSTYIPCTNVKEDT